MYLISIYFDEKTNERINKYIKQVANKSGNTFMTDGNVPPHITISAFETKDETKVIDVIEEFSEKLKQGELQWVTVGIFLPSVIYIEPVLNEYLHEISEKVYEYLHFIEDISISKYYRPFQWLPHTTIGKTLTKDEMTKAFEVLQNQFGVFEGRVIKIALAKTNPYRDLRVWNL